MADGPLSLLTAATTFMKTKFHRRCFVPDTKGKELSTEERVDDVKMFNFIAMLHLFSSVFAVPVCGFINSFCMLAGLWSEFVLKFLFFFYLSRDRTR